MEFATSTPEMIADAMVDVLKAPAHFKPVETEGVTRAARMLADLLCTKGRQRFVHGK